MWNPLEGLFVFVRYTRWLLILLWLGMLALGVLKGPDFFNKTKDDMTSDYDSQSQQAIRAMGNAGMMGYLPRHAVTVVVSSTAANPEPVFNNDGVVYSGLQQVAADLDRWPVAMVVWYGAFNGTNTTLLAPQFISQDQRSTLFILAVWYDGAWMSLDWSLENSLRQNIPAPLYSYAVLSYDELSHGVVDAVTADLSKMDVISIPVALLVLAWRVDSLSLLLIPVLCLGISLLVGFAMLSNAADHRVFPSFSPAFFVSTGLAVGFDYSLFLLTRFKESFTVHPDWPNDECVRDTVLHAGHAILVSGITLCVCYLGMLAFPINFLSSVGAGAAMMLVCCILVNLTLTPALLLSFPRLFRMDCSWRALVRCCSTRVCVCAGASSSSHDAETLPLKPKPESTTSASETDNGAETADARLINSRRISAGDGSSGGGKRSGSRNNIWGRCGHMMAKRPFHFIVAIVLCGLPLTIYASKFKYTIDQRQLWSKDTAGFDVLAQVDTQFGVTTGTLNPYYLIAVVAPGTPPSPHLVMQLNACIQNIIDRTGITPFAFNGPTWINGTALDLGTILQYINGGPEYGSLVGYLYRKRVFGMGGSYINENAGTFATEIDVPFDPNGDQAQAVIDATYAAMDQFATPEVSFYMGLGLTEMYDVVQAVFHEFPMILGVTVAVLLVIVFVAYRSLAAALRLVFTVSITLSWCYGSGIIVFQTGLFASTSEGMAFTRSFFWMAPILTFSLIIGLALDYDIFLTSRIREYRQSGLSDQESIIAGLESTGGIITTAGVIMVIAFGSLMLSSQMVLVEAGFLICFSVLLDTFVVRSMLVPSIMFALSKYQGTHSLNWWPSKMPEPHDMLPDDGDAEYEPQPAA